MKKFITHLQNILFILYLSCNIIFASQGPVEALPVEALKEACKVKNIEPFNKIIKEKQVNKRIGRYTPLFIAAMYGYGEAVNALLEVGAEVNELNGKDQGSALYAAINKGHISIAEKLLDRENIDINQLNKRNQFSVLYLAISKGHISIAEKLLAHGIKNINQLNGVDKCSALYVAISEGHISIAEKIIAYKDIDINQLNKRNQFSVLYLAANKRNPQVLGILLRAKINNMIFISPNSYILPILSIITLLCCIYYFGPLYTILIYSIYLVSSVLILITFSKGLILIFIGGIYLSILLFPTLLPYLIYLFLATNHSRFPSLEENQEEFYDEDEDDEEFYEDDDEKFYEEDEDL